VSAAPPPPTPRPPAEPGPAARPVPGDATTDAPPIVDWRRTARRLRAVLVVIALVVVVAWIVEGVIGDGVSLRRLGEFTGLGLLVAFVAEVVVVGGSAVRGLLAAGQRGHRLARGDVGLLPPQLQRRGHRGGRAPEG
jgi:hypothetical protein